MITNGILLLMKPYLRRIHNERLLILPVSVRCSLPRFIRGNNFMSRSCIKGCFPSPLTSLPQRLIKFIGLFTDLKKKILPVLRSSHCNLFYFFSLGYCVCHLRAWVCVCVCVVRVCCACARAYLRAFMCFDDQSGGYCGHRNTEYPALPSNIQLTQGSRRGQKIKRSRGRRWSWTFKLAQK